MNEHWLLILDNADDLAIVDTFLPADMKGHLLITTRAQAVGTLANTLDVTKMSINEGITLLLRRAKRIDKDQTLDKAKAQDRAEEEVIVRELDGLPLALDQAGGTLKRPNVVSLLIEKFTRNIVKRYSNIKVLFQQIILNLLQRPGRSLSKTSKKPILVQQICYDYARFSMLKTFLKKFLPRALFILGHISKNCTLIQSNSTRQ